MRTRFLLPALLALGPWAAFAQPTAGEDTTAPEDSVMATVVRLFDAMRSADSSAVRVVFHPIATLYSIGADRAGTTTVRATPVDRFIEAVGSPREEVWDERLGDAEVRLDGDLATVWAPYAFYIGEVFSHCGTNAFHLAHNAGSWQIVHITDTRRANGCDASIE